MPAGPAGPGVAERAAAAAQVLVADPDAPDLDPADRHHLARVLRLRPGEAVVATDGRGRWRVCRYRGGSLEPDGPVHREPAPWPLLTVAFAPVKGDRPEWVAQKLTELGIDRIVPLVTARGVVRWEGERRAKAVERLRRVAAEAAGQCRRVWLPEVTEPVGLADLPRLLAPPDPADQPAPAEPPALAQRGGPPPGPATVVVAVGPEGGWAPDELRLGWPTVGLGPLVLRAETAAVAAGVLLAARRTGTVCDEGPRG